MTDEARDRKIYQRLEDTIKSILVGATGYATLHLILQRLPNRLQSRLPVPDRSLFLLNSLISGTAGIAVLGSNSFKHNILKAYPHWLHRSFGAFAGYIMYDLVLLVRNGTSDSNLIIHHIATLAGTFGTMCVQIGSFFPAAMLVTENSLPAVYAVQSLRRRGYDAKSTLFRATVYARLITILLTRTFTAPFTILYAYVYIKRQLLSQRLKRNDQITYKDVINHIRQKMPPLVLYLTTLNLSLFTMLNLIWTLKTYRQSTEMLRLVRGQGGSMIV